MTKPSQGPLAISLPTIAHRHLYPQLNLKAQGLYSIEPALQRRSEGLSTNAGFEQPLDKGLAQSKLHYPHTLLEHGWGIMAG